MNSYILLLSPNNTAVREQMSTVTQSVMLKPTGTFLGLGPLKRKGTVQGLTQLPRGRRPSQKTGVTLISLQAEDTSSCN